MITPETVPYASIAGFSDSNSVASSVSPHAKMQAISRKSAIFILSVTVCLPSFFLYLFQLLVSRIRGANFRVLVRETFIYQKISQAFVISEAV